MSQRHFLPRHVASDCLFRKQHHEDRGRFQLALDLIHPASSYFKFGVKKYRMTASREYSPDRMR
jgi:hypothetical protein